MSLIRTSTWRAIGATGILCALIGTARADAAPETKTILTAVTIIDVRTGAATPNQDVVIVDGRIAQIVPTSQDGRSGATVIDTHGQFLIPGLLEMHAHPLDRRDSAAYLSLMLANGITGVRQMQGSTDLLAQRRAGKLIFPDPTPAILAIPGSILTPANAANPGMAVATIDAQKAAGADFIKVIAVNAATFSAAQAEATKVGLPFVGHVPEGVDILAASKAGMRSIEHLGAGDGLMVACSSEESSLKQEIAKLPVLKGPPFKIPYLEEFMAWRMKRMLVNPVISSDPSDVDRIARAAASFSEEVCTQAADVFVANGTWVVPTLIRLRTMELGDLPEFAENPDLKFVSADTLELWRDVAKDFTAKVPPASKAAFALAYATQLRLVKLLHDRGVKMMAGSDTGGGWLVPGFAFHRELDELARAGLTPLDILQMATLNGAEFLGRTATMGSIDVGKNADLVLLDANPVESVKNLHQIRGVVRAGRYYSRADLDSLMAAARAN